MTKLKLHKSTIDQLYELKKSKRVVLEGNILKIIDTDSDAVLKQYVDEAIEDGKAKQRQRLEITRQIQTQKKELIEAQEENERIQEQLRQTLLQVDSARHKALNDLDVLQKRTQFQLINLIVKISLIIIIGVGVTTTVLYMVALFADRDTQIIGSTWSNMFGILLTNAFSIIGTIMGVKYASEKPAK